jgi:hypothetical protein
VKSPTKNEHLTKLTVAKKGSNLDAIAQLYAEIVTSLTLPAIGKGPVEQAPAYRRRRENAHAVQLMTLLRDLHTWASGTALEAKQGYEADLEVAWRRLRAPLEQTWPGYSKEYFGLLRELHYKGNVGKWWVEFVSKQPTAVQPILVPMATTIQQTATVTARDLDLELEALLADLENTANAAFGLNTATTLDNAH